MLSKAELLTIVFMLRNAEPQRVFCPVDIERACYWILFPATNRWVPQLQRLLKLEKAEFTKESVPVEITLDSDHMRELLTRSTTHLRLLTLIKLINLKYPISLGADDELTKKGILSRLKMLLNSTVYKRTGLTLPLNVDLDCLDVDILWKQVDYKDDLTCTFSELKIGAVVKTVPELGYNESWWVVTTNGIHRIRDIERYDLTACDVWHIDDKFSSGYVSNRVWCVFNSTFKSRDIFYRPQLIRSQVRKSKTLINTFLREHNWIINYIMDDAQEVLPSVQLVIDMAIAGLDYDSIIDQLIHNRANAHIGNVIQENQELSRKLKDCNNDLRVQGINSDTTIRGLRKRIEELTTRALRAEINGDNQSVVYHEGVAVREFILNEPFLNLPSCRMTDLDVDQLPLVMNKVVVGTHPLSSQQKLLIRTGEYCYLDISHLYEKVREAYPKTFSKLPRIATKYLVVS